LLLLLRLKVRPTLAEREFEMKAAS
jgi:hypothetical protein